MKQQQIKIYLVATPIGHLGDLSLHAQAVLREVDFVLCEDTRHSLKLLTHFQISAKLESLHAHNEKSKLDFLFRKIEHSEGKQVALITDAGTPCISDPGSFFLAEAHGRGCQILNVPGPSSLICALASSGFLQPRTLFCGFLGRSVRDQFAEFRIWKCCSPCVVILFESPKRVLSTLKNMMAYFGSCIEVCVSREISKKFEEHKRGTLEEVFAYFSAQPKILGEFTLSVNVSKDLTQQDISLPCTFEEKKPSMSLEDLAQTARAQSVSGKEPLKLVCKKLALEHGISAKELYGKTAKAQK